MSTSPRVKKPDLPRRRPIRSWSTLFGSTGASPAAGAAGAGAGAPSVEEALSRSIDLGYRVVDEYVRRGQEAARRLGGRPPGLGEIGGDVQDLVSRMAQYASDFAALWVELVERAAAGAASRATSAPVPAAADGSGNGAAPRSSASESGEEPLRVRLEVSCSRPTEVRLDLQPGSGRGPIAAHSLRAADPGKPRLTEVSLHPDGDAGAVTLHVRIPDAQPPGIYNGLLIDEESGVPVGTLSVRVLAG